MADSNQFDAGHQASVRHHDTGSAAHAQVGTTRGCPDICMPHRGAASIPVPVPVRFTAFLQ